MNVLFLLSIGLGKQATSSHLLIPVIKAICDMGNSVHIIQKSTGGSDFMIPVELQKCPVTTDVVTFEEANKIILENMGTHFDKGLEKYYIQAREKIEEFYKKDNK